MSDEPHERPSRRQLLIAAGAVAAGRVSPSIDGTPAATAAGRGDGMLRARTGYDVLFGAIAPGAGATGGRR